MKKLDFVIILIIILLGIGIYYIYFEQYKINENDDLYVEVLYRNEVLYRVKLEETTDETYVIDKDNHHNIVRVTYNRIWMKEADCPDKYCLRMGMSYRYFTPIICTNGVVVRIVGASFDDTDYIVP